MAEIVVRQAIECRYCGKRYLKPCTTQAMLAVCPNPKINADPVKTRQAAKQRRAG